MSLSFEKNGYRTLYARLFTASTDEVVSWNITVTNEAPTIDTWSPEDLLLVIEKEQEMAFEVVATDGDGDALHYNWTMGNVSIPGEGSSSCRITLHTSGLTSYPVNVVITDGEASVIQEWTIQPEHPGPHEPPPGPQEEDGHWRAISVGGMVLVLIAGVVTFSYLYVRRGEK